MYGILREQENASTVVAKGENQIFGPDVLQASGLTNLVVDLAQVVHLSLTLPVVAQRDFVCTELMGKLGDNFLCIRASINHPLCPETSGLVRGKIKFQGWLVEPRSDNACVVILLDSTDLADDMLPPMVARLGVDRCLQRMLHLRSVCRKRRAETPAQAH